ncbi:regulator of G-protein signaling 9-binding protein [Narcine bancroftii]|uniref:regulator of G-protein signaling 9-binding protein n=1 Tax=Narcine bancroftii TaxID=1343680 RepID=UPI003831D631
MSGPRVSLRPAQTLHCLRSFLRAQLAEPGWAAGLLGECGWTVERLEALSAAHRDLARGLGSSADSAALRQRLLHTRCTVRQKSAATGIKLLLLLRRMQSLEPQDQEQLKNWWLRFAFCMELFQRDLGLVHHLSQLFPLNLLGTFLTNTGVTCDPAEPHADQSEELDDREDTDCMELSLEAQITEIEMMLQEVESKIQAPNWCMEATAEAWAEASFGDGCSTDSPDMLTEEEAMRGSGCATGDCCTIA